LKTKKEARKYHRKNKGGGWRMEREDVYVLDGVVKCKVLADTSGGVAGGQQ